MTDTRTNIVKQQLSQLQLRWGWFIGIGLLLVVLGVLALGYAVFATLASVIFIATLMIIGGVGQLIHAWNIRSSSNFLLWSLAGLLYISAGVLGISNPIAGAAFLTVLLGGFLIAMGALRLWIWLQNRTQQGWKSLAISGFFSLLAGLLIAGGWPENSLFLLGMILAIDLLFQGWGLIGVGLALKRRSL